jgi:hypothetical protein
VKVPDQLVKQASALAQERGDVLTAFVHSAVITATKAAEAGHHARLPKRLPTRAGEWTGEEYNLRYTASREQYTRCTRALERAGSSLRIVIITALQAYVDAGGDWLDTTLPGEARARARRASEAA